MALGTDSFVLCHLMYLPFLLFLRRGGVIEDTDWPTTVFPRLATGKSRIPLPRTDLMVDCDILLLVRSSVYRINSLYIVMWQGVKNAKMFG